MKNIKNWKALLLAVLMMLSAVALCACGEGTPANDGTPAYKVTVKDALGQPYTTGVIVRFMQNGQQAAMQVVDETGVAQKELAAGDYTVELMFTDNNASYHYEKNDLTLSAEKTELEVILSYGLTGEGIDLNVPTGHPTAYSVGVGCTYAQMKTGRNYFLFTPTEAGKYEFSLKNAEGTVGYYGAPHFVQENNAAETTEENTVVISVKASMIGTNGTGTTTLIIGVDVDAEKGGILAVERIGDPDHTLEDEPWTVYKTTATLTPYTFPAGATTADFDLTAPTYTLVMGDDGYYHLNTADGPLVLAKLGSAAEVDFIDPFQTILDHSGVSKYFFDEEGNFVKKESYSECLIEYFDYIDEDTGLYPLTEDIKYIIQQRGEYSGWFDPEDSLYLFKDENMMNIPNINHENAWLFMCCYLEQ